MNIRLLEPDEYERLRGLANPDDTWIPSPTESRILVAERDGEIIAFWGIQAEIHIEPVWVKPKERCGGWGRQMLEELRKIIPTRYYAFTESDQVADYMERLGMREMGYRTFMGGFQ
jgi:hypothetical protein